MNVYEDEAQEGGRPREEVFPESLGSTTITVPGASAPTLNITSIWNSMPRWLLKSGCSFAQFLHSYLCNSLSVEGRTTGGLWPIASPYPNLFYKHGSSAAATLPVSLRAKRKAVNLAVLALSWLFMSKPVVCPKLLNLGSRLSGAQWRVVRLLESQMESMEVGNVGPSEMGRSAARIESLENFLHDLHSQVEEFLPRGYMEKCSMRPGCSDEPAKPGHEHGDPGEVVGQLSSGAPVLAKSIDASRLSFPQGPPEFDPRPFLDKHHQQVFEDPIQFAREPDITIEQPPRVRIHATHAEALGLLKCLDKHKRLRMAPASKVRRSHLCGAFALVKDISKDRLILDARPPNLLEDTLRSWCKTLGSLQALSQTEIAYKHNLYFSGTDLRDFYYCFKVSRKRSYRNSFNFPLRRHVAQQFSCFPDDQCQHTDEYWYPALSTMAMGDNNAVETGQASHVQLAITSRALQPTELLCTHGRAPRGLISGGIVIDDLVIAEQLPASAAVQPTEGTRRLDKLCEEYLQRNLTPHPSKTFRLESKAEFWGAAVDGEKGELRANPKRVIPLIEITLQVCRLGYSTMGLLEILAGAWVAVLQVRRRLMCLLDEIYVAQRDRRREDIIRLSPSLLAELWVICILCPFAAVDMRSPSLSEVFLSDASDWGTASVVADVPQVLCQEFQRHCLTRGSWSKLLTPWKTYLREHGELGEGDELPEGVPLVSHPLWSTLGKCLQFRIHSRKESKQKTHINLLEMDAILAVENKLAQRKPGCRYLLGSDSQVALAAICKGRSSSFSLNLRLQRSLAIYVGGGLTGNYGYLPSLVNVADDPTRGLDAREPCEPLPSWWSSACSGDFTAFDTWLSSLDYDPMQLAELPPELVSSTSSVSHICQFLQELRSVQKPERLQRFDLQFLDSSKQVSRQLNKKKNFKREQLREPEGQTKKKEKDPNKISCEGPICQAVVSHEEVAPPPTEKSSCGRSGRGATVAGFDSSGTASGSGAPHCGGHRDAMVESLSADELSSEAIALLGIFPADQFFAPGGKRASAGFSPKRKGFLDLYSGKCGIPRRLSKKFFVWVLTFDYEHSPLEDLLDAELQRKLLTLINLGAFIGLGAGLECCSFSRAVTPAVRTREFPEGLLNISDNMRKKIAVGNRHAAFVLAAVKACITMAMVYYVENPDSSFLWLQPDWVDSGLGRAENAYRFDMCIYGTPWRKRTRFATNTGLSGLRELCTGGHSHLQLRGRSTFHRCCWTKVAQEYPGKLCDRIADAMGSSGELSRGRKLSIAGCAKCGHSRIGEASNPGPRRPNRVPRDPRVLVETSLVEPATRHIQSRVWTDFRNWLITKFSPETVDQVFLSAPLAVQLLRAYGIELFSAGRGLYELRHLLVLTQQKFPTLKPMMSPAWALVSQWEEVQPLRHRDPMPEVIFQAMFSVACLWKWRRFAATALLGIEGIARISEVLEAVRANLILPQDMFDPGCVSTFLKISKPKSRRRGKGRVQHIKVTEPRAIKFLTAVFGPLDDFLPLFPFSASAFRNRWHRILTSLKVPKQLQPNPSSLRGGGAVLAYRRNEAITEIMWRMRVLNQSTLESYLQEVAADSLLVRLPEESKHQIRFYASLYPMALSSGSSANTVRSART